LSPAFVLFNICKDFDRTPTAAVISTSMERSGVEHGNAAQVAAKDSNAGPLRCFPERAPLLSKENGGEAFEEPCRYRLSFGMRKRPFRKNAKIRDAI